MAQSETSAPIMKARTHYEARPFKDDANAANDVDAALARAAISGKAALIVMGANWCHDSRGLAGRFETAKFQSLIDAHYELVYVTAGIAPGQKNMNQDVSSRFGVKALEGTPTVFITDASGTVLNGESAGYWRRADSMPDDLIYAYFTHYASR